MQQLTDLMTAISHPTRRTIIGQLASGGPARFLEVAKPFDTALNAVTKHLKLLERAGLIERRKQGREVFISFRGEPLREVAGWVHEYERFWNERLDQFEQYFKDKKEKNSPPATNKGEDKMPKSKKTLEFKFERIIPASPGEVHDAWLNPKIPGNPWHEGDKLILDPKIDGLFYWLISGTSHYGRFTEVARPGRIQHTWVSPYTLGEESTVTVTFRKKGENTLMTLVHSGLPDTDGGRKHEKGWTYFLDIFPQQFGNAARKRK
jgi:DNA-binding transcriptional ArsR family regulator/uncharacterized protein YndB with AHSA1/START domain